MRTNNPVLNSRRFNEADQYDSSQLMSIQGVVNKTFILVLFCLATASWVWKGFFSGNTAIASQWLIPGIIGGLVTALITIFNMKIAHITAPIYCLFEGLVIGGISSLVEASYPGLVIQAVFLTFGTLFVLLAMYRSGLVTVSDKFRAGVIAATGAIALIYFVSILFNLFGSEIPFIHSSGTIGIAFSLFVVVIASMNLILDFDFIERAASQGSPKYMEWYAAFGLMVTLIWLYIEILRLLVKLQRKR